MFVLHYLVSLLAVIIELRIRPTDKTTSQLPQENKKDLEHELRKLSQLSDKMAIHVKQKIIHNTVMLFTFDTLKSFIVKRLNSVSTSK